MVPLLEDYALPERFSATVTPSDRDLPICHLRIVVERGRAVCDELRLERQPGGLPIGRALLHRIPVPEYVSRSVDNAGYWRMKGPGPVISTADGETHRRPTEPAGEGYVATPIVGVARTGRYKAANRAPRRPLSSERLQEVADVYRRAFAKGQHPTEAVRVEFEVSRSTASRWVKRARQEGLLGPAVPRRAGEGPSA